jgi:hypothetical protein
VESVNGVSYEFIQNPAKKAFFEGTRSSSGSATVSPRSVNSPRLKQQVTFKEKADEILPHVKSGRYVILWHVCCIKSSKIILYVQSLSMLAVCSLPFIWLSFIAY